jgi:hypothetical protein
MKIDHNVLLVNSNSIHTTEMGLVRISKNLNVKKEGIVEWCKKQITHPASIITRKGKNWYISINKTVFTVNAHSYTIITAHKVKNTDQ